MCRHTAAIFCVESHKIVRFAHNQVVSFFSLRLGSLASGYSSSAF